jgi:uncharacterized oxidoreductase
LDTLVNNAGYGERYLFAKAKDLEKRISSEWQTNFLAPVLLIQQFLETLTNSKGRIVNINSGLAYIPLSIEPSYCASKAALRSMTQSMRFQLSLFGVKVSEIYFPAVDTAFHGGHTPEHAIKADLAVAVALRQINAGRDEVHVKFAGIMQKFSRIAPKFALDRINGFIPIDVEKILDGRK